jgi:hypothetical protein
VLTAQAASQDQIADESTGPSAARRDDHLVQMRIVPNDRSSGRLDKVGEVRIGKTRAQRGNRRRGEDDVADFAEADEQDPRRR